MTIDLAARYAKAEGVLDHNMRKLIKSPQARPNWIGDTDTFWYLNTSSEGKQFVFVDAASGTKRPAFDHARMATALTELLGDDVDAPQLPFGAIDLADGAVTFAVAEQLLKVSLDEYAVTELGPAPHRRDPFARRALGRRHQGLQPLPPQHGDR